MRSMNIAVRIQHTSSRPRHLLLLIESLRKYYEQVSLGDIDFKVVTDDSGSSWGGLKRVIESVDGRCSHLLVIQDDVIVCKDFLETVEKIVQIHPEQTISFFSPYQEIDKAMRKRQEFIAVEVFYYAQAYVMPMAKVRDFYNFSVHHISQKITQDDRRLAMFHLHRNEPVWVSAPSLVEHLAWDTTTTSNEKGYLPKLKQETRTARHFIGVENSGLDLDWSNPPQITAMPGDFQTQFGKYLL